MNENIKDSKLNLFDTLSDSSAKEAARFVDKLIYKVSEGLLRQGVIDPKGKTTAEVATEILPYIKKILNSDQLSWIIDHTKDLLQTARSYYSNEQYELSNLFYALWFEHWINDLIISAALRKGIEQKVIKQIIRDTDLFRGKTSWLLELLDVPKLNKKHLERIKKIIESRNSFVHYKWQRINTENDKPSEITKSNLMDIDKTIKYFQAFKHKFLYSGVSKDQLKRKIIDKTIEQIT